MYVIGVTGGVGAGKSEVLKYLEEHVNCRVLYTDRVANELELKGAPCYEPLVALLGHDVLDETGEIDRKKMAAKVFRDAAYLQQVNAIVHPAVYDFVTAVIEEETALNRIEFLFLEAALLIEAGYGKIVKEMWVVHADAAVRRERLKASRGYDDARIDGIMKGQLSDEDFRKGADFVLDNSGDFDDTVNALEKHLNTLRVR